MIRTLIIDDETNGRETLKGFLGKYCPQIKIIGEADGVKTGMAAIGEHTPDLVFLDIQMQDGTGFDLLELIPAINFKLIFVTSFDQYAIRAFKYSAVDYILKPVDPDQLMAAVNRLNAPGVISSIENKLNILISNIRAIEKLALPTSDGMRFVKIEEIVRCESDSCYTTFFMKSKEKIMVSKTLKEYELLLSDMGFFRVHKSHLVNLRYVEKYVQGEGGYLVMEDKVQVEISRRKKEGLLAILNNF